MIELTKLTPELLDQIWANRREVDRLSHDRIGLTEPSTFLRNQRGICGWINGEPAGAFGYQEHEGTLYTWILLTPAVELHWKEITRLARQYLKGLSRQGMPIALIGHTDARVERWYQTIGFEPQEVLRADLRKYSWRTN